MSIKDFVATLNMDQLAFCAREVDSRLRHLKEGEKVQIWIVTVDLANRFASTDHQDVLRWLQAFLAKRIESGKLEEFSVQEMYVYPSEVESWREINEKPEDV